MNWKITGHRDVENRMVAKLHQPKATNTVYYRRSGPLQRTDPCTVWMDNARGAWLYCIVPEARKWRYPYRM